MRHESISGEVVAAASQNIKERNYWLEKLGGRLERAFFPYDYPQTVHEGKMDIITFQFSNEISSRFMQLSKQLDYNLHMILIAGIVAILEKYTASNDIMIGAPIYKQKDEGRFINTFLVLRHQIEEARTFKELLLLVRKTLIEAVEHQNYPLETLLYKLNIEYIEGEFPLADIAVLLENIHDKKYIRDINLNMIFSFLRTGNSIEGKLEYNPQRYLRQSVERYINHLVNFLNTALFNIDMPMANIQILSEAERRQLIDDFNDTSARSEYLEGKTIYSLFSDQVKKSPGNLAVKGPPVFTPTPAQEETLTYEMLARKVNQLADLLIKKGIINGDIIGIMMKRSLEMIVAMLGVLKVGGAYLPIDPEYPHGRIQYILRDSNAKLLLIKEGLAKRIDSEMETISIHLENSIYDVEPSQWEAVSRAENIAYVIYTSGSTGRPKGVMVEHRSIVNTLFWRKNFYQFNEHDRVMQIPSFSFDSSVEDIFTPLISGSGLVLLQEENRYNVEYIKTLIEKNSITHFLIVPGFFKILLTEIPRVLKRLKSVTVAGEGFTANLVKEHFEALPNVKMYNEYGPTENSVCSTVYEFSINKTKVLIGKPITNVSCFICSAVGMLAAVGVYGELCVSGKGLARGYLNNPGLTSEKFVDNPFLEGKRMYLTGDVARWKPDGNIEFSGRDDHQVKIRGFRIEPGEVEERLLKHETVNEAVVIMKEDEKGEKYLCAYLASDKKINVPGLKESLSKDLPYYMIPSKFIQLNRFPLLVNGKVDRKALPEPEVDAGEEYTPPRDEIERKFVEIWANVLGLQPGIIGIDSDFFNLGGHSLSATILVSKIHKQFNVKIPLKEIFKSPTIRELAAILKESVKNEFVAVEPVEKKEYYAVSSSQYRLYILQQMNIKSTAYNVPLAVEWEGEVNKEKLKETFGKLIDRHESLRTSFIIVEDVPVQKIHQEAELEIEYYDISDSAAPDPHLVTSIIERFIGPFDLAKAPLIRLGSIKIDSLRQILIVDLHHIITDLISHSILIKDFMALYNDVRLPGFKLQYKDYSQWQQSDPVKEALKKEEEFWLKEFSGEIPVLNLPTDYIRPSIQSFEGNKVDFEFGEKETAALNEMAQLEDATLFMVLLAIYTIFLSKISSQEDIVIGTPVASRRHADLEKINGMFVNTIALRNHLPGEKTFKTFFRELRERVLGAFENQDYLFEDLVEKVELKRDISRNPLFDVMLVFQSSLESLRDTREQKTNDLKIKPYSYEKRTSKFDLTLGVTEIGEKLYFSVVYGTKLFKEETIVRFIDYFKKVMASIINNPGKKLAEIEIISGEEKNRVLYDFNDTHTEYPQNKTIHHLFAEQVEKTPDRISLVGPILSEGKADESPIQITYRQVKEKSDRLCHQLKRKGVQPDTIAAIMIEHSPEMIVGVLGILKAGGAYLPIDPEYPQERINYMLEDSAAKILVTGSEIKDRLNTSTLTSTINRVTPDNLVYVIYTSGTTGKPKGTLIENKNLVNYSHWFRNKVNLTGNDRSVLTSSFCFDLGYTVVYPSIISGCQLHVIPRDMYLSLENLIGYIIRHRITYLKMTPSLFSTIVEGSDFTTMNRGSLRLVVLGGEEIKIKDVEKFHAALPGIEILNHYGPTEATIGCAARKIDFERFEQYKKRPVIGHPIHNMRIYILDKGLMVVPVGISGELCVCGSSVGRGYLNRPQLTAEKFIKKTASDTLHMSYTSHMSYIYRTGDMARWIEPGALQFLGRIDSQVKIRGYRIETGEIENHLLKHEAIKEAAVIPRQFSSGDNYLCAYIVWKPGKVTDKEAQLQQLKELLPGKLPEYMIPSYFVEMERIPLTPNGKINRKLLPEPRLKMVDGYAAPRDQIEEKLAEIWSGLVSIAPLKEAPGIDDNFFQRGGHSLSAAIMAARIHKELNIKLPLVEIFKAPTIRGMAKYITGAIKDKFIAIEPVEAKEYYALSAAQQRLYIIQQINPGSIAYNMPLAFILEGDIDKDRLSAAFNGLIKRHDSLRTSFIMVEEEPVQRIHDEMDFEIEYYDTSLQSVHTAESIIKNFIRPFDLAKAPMMRVGLIKQKQKEYILVVDMHHIMTDGVSNTILNRDFILVYAKEQLPPIKLQYKDFSEWYNTASKKELLERQEEYWIQKFKGEIPTLNLPTDYEMPERSNYEGKSIHFLIPRQISQRLKDLNNQTGTTLFIFMAAALNILLFLYTGQEDIIIGSPITGRNHIDLQNIIGMFINMLSLRNRPNGRKTFVEFLKEVKQNIMEAFENQDYQFDELVRKLGIDRKSDKNPLFNVVLAVQNIDTSETDRVFTAHRDDLKLSHYPSNTIIERFGLTFFAREVNEDIHILTRYSTALFKEETMRKLGEHYIEIIDQVTNNPGIKPGEIILSSSLLHGSHVTKENDVAFDF
ncbi:MAG: amino acid adenylation domain-containing protein [Candidatus Aminicenantes bacterium]|nr:MAG: amino acid adenylation domain-containing protein [Candidatus Aminicenantes bacterium]